eukprot:CAMPEP_0204630876 /NCGR_PEP_ID=MMETSP0717-20131115/21470_1 /ASSEMBLY_ACC=CAM_ASM_000666 /TAXON_ID=230516 /ORGANISM="Chaetoceros curvisetus" /LENGTH=37 /DNA_ID= /DNA_START= /DNA_END= /DNA_ORIENTATION=
MTYKTSPNDDDHNGNGNGNGKGNLRRITHDEKENLDV